MDVERGTRPLFTKPAAHMHTTHTQLGDEAATNPSHWHAPTTGTIISALQTAKPFHHSVHTLEWKQTKKLKIKIYGLQISENDDQESHPGGEVISCLVKHMPVICKHPITKSNSTDNLWRLTHAKAKHPITVAALPRTGRLAELKHEPCTRHRANSC